MSDSVKNGLSNSQASITEGANNNESNPSEVISLINVDKLATHDQTEKVTVSKEVHAERVDDETTQGGPRAKEKEPHLFSDAAEGANESIEPDEPVVSNDLRSPSLPIQETNVVPDVIEGANEKVDQGKEVPLDKPADLSAEALQVDESCMEIDETAKAHTNGKPELDDAVLFKESTQIEEKPATPDSPKLGNKNEKTKHAEAVLLDDKHTPDEEVLLSRPPQSKLCTPHTTAAVDSNVESNAREVTTNAEKIKISRDMPESIESKMINEKAEANDLEEYPITTAAIKDSTVTPEINEEVKTNEIQSIYKELSQLNEDIASATPAAVNDILAPQKKSKVSTTNNINGEASESRSEDENLQGEPTQITLSGAAAKDTNLVIESPDESYQNEELTAGRNVLLKESNERISGIDTATVEVKDSNKVNEVNEQAKTNDMLASVEKVLVTEANEMGQCAPTIRVVVADDVNKKDGTVLKMTPQITLKRSRLLIENDDNDHDTTSKKPRVPSPTQTRKLYTVLKPPKDSEDSHDEMYAEEIANRIKKRLPPSISVSVKHVIESENGEIISKEKNTTMSQGNALEKQPSLASIQPIKTAASKSSITDALLPPIAPIPIPVTRIQGSAYNSLVCTSIASKLSSITNTKDTNLPISANENTSLPAVITITPSTKDTLSNQRLGNLEGIRSVKIVPRNCTVIPIKSSNLTSDNRPLITSIKILPLNPALLKVASKSDHSKEIVATNPYANKNDLTTLSDNNTCPLDSRPMSQRKEDTPTSDAMPSFSKLYLKSLSDYIREAKAYNAAAGAKMEENDESEKSGSVATTLEDIESDLITYEIFNNEWDHKVIAKNRNMGTQTKDSITNILGQIAALKEKTSQQAEEIASLKAAMKLLNSTIDIKNIKK